MAYELNAPYSSLMLQYQPLSDELLKDAMNRARQIGSQSAAARGGGVARGPALNTYNRLMSDYNLQRDREELNRQLAVQRGNTSVMALPQAVTPTWKTQSTQALGGLLGNFGGTLATQAGKLAADKLFGGGGGGGTWGMTAPQAVQQYQALTSGGMPNSVFPTAESDPGGAGVSGFGPDVGGAEWLGGQAALSQSPFGGFEAVTHGMPDVPYGDLVPSAEMWSPLADDLSSVFNWKLF